MATLSPRPTSAETQSPSHESRSLKPYDFLLKFLLVGDSDVGKEEILNGLANGPNEFPYAYSTSELLYQYFITSIANSLRPLTMSTHFFKFILKIIFQLFLLVHSIKLSMNEYKFV